MRTVPYGQRGLERACICICMGDSAAFLQAKHVKQMPRRTIVGPSRSTAQSLLGFHVGLLIEHTSSEESLLALVML